MFTRLLCLVVITASPLSASVVKQEVASCSPTEFLCGDGGCVSSELVCDGSRDCADGADELSCGRGSITLNADDEVIHRSRRQATQCRKDQWQCRDGSCISFDGNCDGVIDCRDSSDETHALCRKTLCQPNWFRCTYGACVDGTVPCNNIQECADNSDELLPRCRNETSEVRGQFICADGTAISAINHCDGVTDCVDGSDETIRTCAAKSCPSYLFQCAYGACVDSGADCNRVQDCADGSDEDQELCDRNLPTTSITVRPQRGNCILPDYPAHGMYVTNIGNAKPGNAFHFVTINVTCLEGYGVEGSPSAYCYNGQWQGTIGKCIVHCHLKRHPSVEFRCLVSGPIEGSRACNEYEPTGTVVSPQCRAPNYYSPNFLPFMHCIDGNWDYTARCSPECGTVTPDGTGLIIGGVSAKYAEVPWHAAIYSKELMPYKQVCGGSLISNTIILSAAHCFWDKVQNIPQPANLFAVGVGKLYRSWVDPEPPPGVIFPKSQTADVLAIHIADRYQDSAANYQADIAVVVVATPFKYETYIRPVCINFDIRMENSQLQPGLKGKVAGWGLTAENGTFGSQILKVTSLSYVSPSECIRNSPKEFQSYITSDKICAGDINDNTALCKGDSGGGLTFPQIGENNTPRYHLRGIVSTASKDELKACNEHTYTTFTQIMKHEDFIRKHWRA